MTAPVLALTKLYDDVVARFALEAASIDAPIYVFAGTSIPTVDASSLALIACLSAQLRVAHGGTVGSAGVTYETSIDGGTTWSAPVALGTSTTAAIPTTGVVIHLGAGTLVAGDLVTVATSKTTPPTQVFGWRERAKRTGKLRIVWIPGNDGDVGELGSARQPGRNARSLATLGELFVVDIEAQDPASPEDERAQYIAARLLFDAWFRAAYHAGRDNLTIKSVKWVDGKNERRFGATLRVVGAIQAMVPDAPYAVAPVDTTGSLAVTELDVTEETASV